jgi:cold shock protein
MATGTVKWFNEEKGIGFITPEGGGEDLFVHHSEFRSDAFNALREGEVVCYDTWKDLKGPNAVNVKRPLVGALAR